MRYNIGVIDYVYMPSDLFKNVVEYVKKQMLNEPTGHDWYHVVRVLKIARKLQALEGGDLELIDFGVVLHDLGDYKNYEYDEDKARLILCGMMGVLEIPNDLQRKVEKIVSEIQYRGMDTVAPTSLEAKIIRDADWLDALGAVGVARTFATGGRVQRVLHDPKRQPRRLITAYDYLHKKREGTSLNYFYEKILQLPDMMNTDTAKLWARKRAAYVENFIQQFLLEWEVEDLK